MNKKRIAQYCCAALVAAGVGLNIQNAIADYGIAENSLSLVAVGGSNSNGSSNSNSNSNTSTAHGTRPKGPYQREVLVGAGMYVTEVTGSAHGSVHIGMRLSNGVAAELEGKIKAEKQDEFKICCHPNGDCPCSSEDWHMCASSGCPKRGFYC